MTLFEKMPENIKTLLYREIISQFPLMSKQECIEIARIKVNNPLRSCRGFTFRKVHHEYGDTEEKKAIFWIDVCKGKYSLMDKFFRSKPTVINGETFMV